MARVDPTRNVRHAVRQILPPRPTVGENHRLARLIRAGLGALFLCVALSALFAVLGAPLLLVRAVPAVWLVVFGLAVPMTFLLRSRERERLRSDIGEWESDPRRQAIERLGLDLTAGRMPEGLPPQELATLEAAAADWRLVRESLEAMSWARGELAQVRDRLREQVDEAMANLLAEAGSGSPLGPSPFLLERARELFGEIAGEAGALSRLQARRFDLPTDASLEALRGSLARLREARLVQQELTDHPTLVARNDEA
ncbi:MAG: hypothetical protein ACO1SV_20395 [Fimbriimonas sp.]